MFFPEKKPEIKDQQALNWANTLYECVRQHYTKRLSRKYTHHWAKFFSRLAQKQDPEVITNVLNWYVLHYGEEFVPVANNGEAFVAKFDTIVRAMEQADEQADDFSRVMAQSFLNDYLYPPEIAAKLPVVICKTRVEWYKFCEKIQDHKCRDREANFLNRVLDMHSRNFVPEWLIFLSQKYGNLASYTMPTGSLSFKPTSGWFRESFWHKWSQDWCGSPTAFDNLLVELLK